MSVQDKVERTLREMYVLFSKSEPYEKEPGKIVIDKKEAIELLNQFKSSMSEMMEAYEITTQSRNKGERQAWKKGEELIKDASHKAEDVYAASVLYSDEALSCIQEILQDADDEMEHLFRNIKKEMKAKQQIVRENQMELKSSLGDLKDTNKYLNIIDERNKEIRKNKTHQKQEQKIAVVKPEIKINQEYFEKIGKPLEESKEEVEEEKVKESEIKVNLDAEYFRWKKEQKKES